MSSQNKNWSIIETDILDIKHQMVLSENSNFKKFITEHLQTSNKNLNIILKQIEMKKLKEMKKN